MQLALDFPAPRSPECPYCGIDWELDDGEAIYGCDIRRGEGEQYLTWRACCEELHEDVCMRGFADAYGVELHDVVRMINPGLEVLEVLEDGDGSIVARLHIVDPTVVTGPRTAASPKGWFAEVCADVERHHRHHEAPQGHKFSVAVYNGGVRVGVAVVGRPVSRIVQAREPGTLEVTRVATWGHPALRKNASSKLYAAAAERARQLGYDKLITSILDSEGGHSLAASGWTPVARGKGGSWNTPSRPREDKAPTCPKTVYARGLTKRTRREVEAAGAVFRTTQNKAS